MSSSFTSAQESLQKDRLKLEKIYHTQNPKLVFRKVRNSSNDFGRKWRDTKNVYFSYVSPCWPWTKWEIDSPVTENIDSISI